MLKKETAFYMPDYNEKLILGAIYLTNNSNITEEKKSNLWNYILVNKPELTKLEQTGYIARNETGDVFLTSLGVSIASKVFKTGINFERSAREGNVGNAMAMLSGALNAIKEKVLDGHITLYEGAPLQKLLIRMIQDCTEILEKSTVSSAEEVSEN